MKKKLIKILIFILIIFLIGLFCSLIDYLRIKSNKKPVLSYNYYDKANDLVVYQGLFHKIELKYSKSPNEKISDSKSIKYTLLFSINIDVSNVLNTKNYYYIKYKREDICTQSKLIYSNKDYKLYTYCLDNKKTYVENYRSNEEDVLLSEFLKKHELKDLLNDFYYNGFAIDKISLTYTNKDKDNELKLIECKLFDNTDYYLGPKDMEYQLDFCLPKDDVKEEVNTKN